jgi:hypothetical protein
VKQLALLSVRTTPATRGDCETGVRPCPYYACRHHLWAEDERPGRPWHGEHPPPVVRRHSQATCALDVAADQQHRDAQGLMTRDRVGDHLGITGERVRQLELEAVEAFLQGLAAAGVEEERLAEYRARMGADRDVKPENTVLLAEDLLDVLDRFPLLTEARLAQDLGADLAALEVALDAARSRRADVAPGERAAVLGPQLDLLP